MSAIGDNLYSAFARAHLCDKGWNGACLVDLVDLACHDEHGHVGWNTIFAQHRQCVCPHAFDHIDTRESMTYTGILQILVSRFLVIAQSIFDVRSQTYGTVVIEK